MDKGRKSSKQSSRDSPAASMFLGLHIITTDAKGNIYTGDGRDGRVQKFNFTGLAQ